MKEGRAEKRAAAAARETSMTGCLAGDGWLAELQQGKE
jgi:hypothetical protein